MSDTSLTVVRPAVSPAQAREMWQEYEALKKSVATSSDVQKIQGRDFLKKSFWRKLEKCFNLSLQFVEQEQESIGVVIRTIQKGDKHVKEVEYYPLHAPPELASNEVWKESIAFSAVYRATAPNGVYADGDGHCDIWEKGYANSYHNAKSTAHTRAKNRAISDLVGGGEVSAEEIVGEYSSTPPASGQTAQEQRGNIPTCPSCGKSSSIIKSKYEDADFVCFGKKGGCGHKWFVPSEDEFPQDVLQDMIDKATTFLATQGQLMATVQMIGKPSNEWQKNDLDRIRQWIKDEYPIQTQEPKKKRGRPPKKTPQDAPESTNEGKDEPEPVSDEKPPWSPQDARDGTKDEESNGEANTRKG